MDTLSVESSRGRTTGLSEHFLYQHFIDMKTLCDRLILLDYEEYVIKFLKMRPINRHYFALQTNSGEQFFMFISLAVWLLNKLGNDLKQPQEYDDPNTTVNNILKHCTQLGLFTDIPINNLKQGFGKHVISILNGLAEKVFEKLNYSFKRPIFPVDKEENEELDNSNAELLIEHIDEEMIWTDTSTDEDNMIDINDLSTYNRIKKQKSLKACDHLKASTTNKEEWSLEVEQVLPSLRVTIKLDSKDWRTSLQQIKENRHIMNTALKQVKPLLGNLRNVLEETVGKIYSREQYLNSTLDNLLVEYRNSQDELARISEHYKIISNGVTERQEVLSKLIEQLDVIKQEMDERGSSMTDGTPLINIKKAIATIKTDIMQMDIRIGVLQHGYFVSKIHEKSVIQDTMMEMRPMFPRNVL
ncbi:intraflagellar transport protein 57 homolog isoform X2 [Adelges cooleyi]|nr:intraflagellar transport protein 57 homolog isoform X2 [Adelges cooleyi]XP_050440669.1 intraflagellar transport protein 57 homolog isoform X2 [Adelges cooleyi]